MLMDIRATFVRVLAYMGGLAILSIIAAELSKSPPVAAAVDPSPRPKWIAVERPYPAFELPLPELAGIAPDYAILRRAEGGSRKDVMTWGKPAEHSPYVVVEVYRPGSEVDRFIDAPSEIAERIVDFAITDDVKAAGEIASKFGPVSLVDFAIEQDGARHRCLGFVRAFVQPIMQIAGWYCSPGMEIVDRTAVACALDRLSLVAARSDPKLGEFFAHAELKRKFCGQRDPILAATPRRTDWVGGPRNVKLRGRIQMR
jgi:hypothetical protein